MKFDLPTAEQLQKLPLRAIVAYAVRGARRLSSELHGLIADDIVEEALNASETMSTTYLLDELDSAYVIRAAGCVTEAYAAAASHAKSLEKFRIVFSVTNAALTAMCAIEAAADPENAHHNMVHAARTADRAVRALEVLDDKAGAAAAEAARKDYEILLSTYREQDDVILGEPVYCLIDAE